MNWSWMILGMVAVTFSVRYLLFGFAGKLKLSARVERALRFVPPSVLTAILVPAVLNPTGKEWFLHYQNPYLVASVVALIVGLVQRRMIVTIVLGMVVFLGWKAVF